MKRALRAFLIGASPDATVEHTRMILDRMKASAATDLFVGVDGGVEMWLKLGLKPHLAVGDWDSYQGAKARKVLAGLHHLDLPVDKDRSDLYYAACAVIKAEATQLICLGVTGGRPDHHLAALMDLTALAAGEAAPEAGQLTQVSAYGPEAEYQFLSAEIPRWKDSFAQPTTISIFAMRGAAQGVSLKGFKYPLKNAQIEPSSRGLSNRSWAMSCEASVKTGSLLVLIPDERYTSAQHGRAP